MVAVAREARKRGLQGVVCGHIHHAEMREIDGILYCNDGDWVESLTALIEHADGRLEIADWSARRAGAALSAGAVAKPATPTAGGACGFPGFAERPVVSPAIARS